MSGLADDVPPNPVASADPGAGVEFPILYEDRWMIAVDKPPGLAVHPSGRWFATGHSNGVALVRQLDGTIVSSG